MVALKGSMTIPLVENPCFKRDNLTKRRRISISGQLREIIAELDPRLTDEDLDGIIEEIDEDGSGTMDFDEFCQMMMTN